MSTTRSNLLLLLLLLQWHQCDFVLNLVCLIRMRGVHVPIDNWVRCVTTHAIERWLLMLREVVLLISLISRTLLSWQDWLTRILLRGGRRDHIVGGCSLAHNLLTLKSCAFLEISWNVPNRGPRGRSTINLREFFHVFPRVEGFLSREETCSMCLITQVDLR